MARMNDKHPATAAPPSGQHRRTDVARLPLQWAAASATKEGEMYRRVVRQLRDHVGGNPSAAQELIIARIAWLQLHMAHIDERAMKDGGLSPHATREYLAWANSLSRMLASLGPPASAKPPTPAEALQRLHDAIAAGAADAAST